MRIAFIAHHGSIHTRRWAAFFSAHGHDVHVVTCGDDAQPLGDYEVHDLGAPRPSKLGYVLRVPTARRIVRRLRPDIVHAHYATSYGLLGLATGVRPLVVTAHGSDLLVSGHDRLYRPILRRVLRAAALVTVPSEEMREVVHALGGDVPVETFQYGIDTGRLIALGRQPRPAGQPLGIVGARPLRRLYRNDVLLDALGVLAERRDDWECVLFGDGPERAALEAQSRRLGLESRVSFVGQQPVDDVERALATAQIYTSFAESDGASIALLEAMALGVVPVVSDTRSNRSWIRDGDNGILSSIDTDAAAAAFERALALDRSTVAAKNRALVVERADRDTNLGRLETMLEELVG